VNVARALYRQPQVLVLDEATSSLDNETERNLTDAMIGLRGRITMVVIAHRLSTVRDCDQVAYMKDGRVEAVGTFEEVQLESAGFARLVHLADLTRAPSVI
jgi:ABC-type multidrug transport system fused ATPase/permease subunit